ncbi:uncharacterized protein PAE49_005975 [Odontesthes bonariensis]|uniref:uncharacterized protein LOC142380905 n=1 Tax=Odontesthes bonariensis TaxID=219752 RepID=UPI003F58B9E9
MASTPSASSLSAVLRCRGNILTRNPPIKRPASAAYSLGLAGAALRDSSPARPGSKQASAWTVVPGGESVLAGGGRLAVSCRWDRVGKEILKEEDYQKNDQLRHAKLSRSSGEEMSHSAPCVQSAVARGLKSVLLGRERCSKIIHMIKYEAHAAHVCEIISVQGTGKLPPGGLKLSVTAPFLVDTSGGNSSLVLTGWSTLKNSCFSLTSLVSRLLLLKLAVLCGSGGGSRAAPHAPRQQESIRGVLQESGQICGSSQDELSPGQEVTQDRTE